MRCSGRTSFSAVIAPSLLGSVGACKLLLMAIALFDSRLFRPSRLRSWHSGLIVLNDRLVHETGGVVDELALSATTALLVQQGYAIVHLDGRLRSWRHLLVMFLYHHSLQ